MDECTCLKCGWVHVAYTRDQAEDAVVEFNQYYGDLEATERMLYSGEADISIYDRCFRCGQTDTTNYRAAKDDDCPRGCTIQPTIWEREE